MNSAMRDTHIKPLNSINLHRTRRALLNIAKNLLAMGVFMIFIILLLNLALLLAPA